jgi:GNAT superfamily N-acetyltransferase
MHLETAIASLEDFYRRIYWQAHGAITRSTRDYTLSYSGVNWLHSVNQLWLNHIDALHDGVLARARDFFAPSGAEYSIVFNGNASPHVINWLSERHFSERLISPIYALDGLPHPRHAHRTVRIERVCAEHQHRLLHVLYSVFFMGPEIGRCIVRAEHFDDPTIRHYLAYVGGEAAACATITLSSKHGKVAGVWNVGTLRPFRRQGVAAALLLWALTEAATEGYSGSVLVASPMGRSLYEEMGYRLIGNSYSYGLLE